MHPYTPFFTPLPLWNYWWVLLFPLVICISVAYKGIKCETMRQVPLQAASITFWILISLVAAAAALSFLVNILEK